ncbi:uncharacterized protein [Macrobrachium rosenbergii]|uniref:uncharacterized protein n=1 Tax=Macrobrachium rosenbergii TaxID=79674 RepID=UPI0034D72B96
MKVSITLLCLIANTLMFSSTVETKPCCSGVGTLAVGALAFAGGVLVTEHYYKHHRHGGCKSCSCGGCGGGCGWCGGDYYGRRRRRSVASLLQEEWVHDVYSMLKDADKDQCGLRLLCELAQRDPRELLQDEVEILLPYRGKGRSDGTIYGDYDEAVWHGQEGHECPVQYPLCLFSSSQIMTEYREQLPANETLSALFRIDDSAHTV